MTKTIKFFQMTKERRWDNQDWPYWMHKAWQEDHGEGALWPNPDDPWADGHESAERLACGTKDGVAIVEMTDWVVKKMDGSLVVMTDEAIYLMLEFIDDLL